MYQVCGGEARRKQRGRQIGVAEGGVCLRGGDRLDVIGDVEAGGGDHVEIVGAVTHGKGLFRPRLERSDGLGQCRALGGASENWAGDFAGQRRAVVDQRIALMGFEACHLRDARGEEGETAGEEERLRAVCFHGGNQRARRD